MSEKKPHFIPHPLCQNDPKPLKIAIEAGLDNIDKYISEASNPRWAASFLVRSIAKGLGRSDIEATMALEKIANDLSQVGRE
jgi:hypothetical protein